MAILAISGLLRKMVQCMANGSGRDLRKPLANNVLFINWNGTCVMAATCMLSRAYTCSSFHPCNRQQETVSVLK